VQNICNKMEVRGKPLWLFDSAHRSLRAKHITSSHVILPDVWEHNETVLESHYTQPFWWQTLAQVYFTVIKLTFKMLCKEANKKQIQPSPLICIVRGCLLVNYDL